MRIPPFCSGRRRIACGIAVTLLFCAAMPAWAGTVYGQDPTLSDFTATITTYGTFVSGALDHGGVTSYTPTNATFEVADYARVIGKSFLAVDVIFGSATNQIVVFDNVDHDGNAWDVYQYKIFGSDDNGASYTMLFDPKTVLDPDVNGHFQLDAYDGTAPTFVNNSLTPGPGSIYGVVGYEEYFTFASAYSRYRFLPSTLTLTTGEDELEVSAVGVAAPSETVLTSGTPEPASFLIGAGGLGALMALRRRFVGR